ncbi:polymorphic toxin type 24 domain-containing protein [Nocardia lijiangensis]|uniref:polymorphic toxin type 24 domain-containing protein n=1 Tax=Nocardia lijiangensis TaxID=299618 RepID=UPI003D740B37
MGSISPQSYESAAKECYDLSEKFQTVYNAMQRVLLETSAMAGGYQAVKTWSKAYDDRAGAVALVATSFARALQHFGDVLTATGYNWKCAEYKANRDPNKGAPPALPSGFPSELPYGPGIVNGVASSGTNSRGLETDWTELQDKVTALVSGGEVPDGDTDKLARAATAWKTFAQSDPVYGGKGRLLVVASGLERGYGSNAPKDIPNLVGHLRTLATSVGDIEAAARDIAAAVDAHKVALTTMRSDMNTQFAMVVVVTAIQIGHSMVQVKEPPTKQKTPNGQKTPSDRQEEIDFLDQAAGALAGPANTFLTKLSGLTFTTAVLTIGGLATIAGLTTVLDPMNGNSVGPSPSTSLKIALDNSPSITKGNITIDNGPPNGYIVKRDANGTITNYVQFDQDGRGIKRVDLTGRAHAGVPTPHVVEMEHDVAPNGKIYVRERKDVRPARPDEIP